MVMKHLELEELPPPILGIDFNNKIQYLPAVSLMCFVYKNYLYTFINQKTLK